MDSGFEALKPNLSPYVSTVFLGFGRPVTIAPVFPYTVSTLIVFPASKVFREKHTKAIPFLICTLQVSENVISDFVIFIPDVTSMVLLVFSVRPAISPYRVWEAGTFDMMKIPYQRRYKE